jgi:AAA family ATP:ADP antiporter
MGVAAILLVVCVVLFAWVGARVGSPGRKATEAHHEEPLVYDHVVRVLARDKYLLLIAGLTLLLNWVRSNGDYLLDRTLLTATFDRRYRVTSTAGQKFVPVSPCDGNKGRRW